MLLTCIIRAAHLGVDERLLELGYGRVVVSEWCQVVLGV